MKEGVTVGVGVMENDGEVLVLDGWIGEWVLEIGETAPELSVTEELNGDDDGVGETGVEVGGRTVNTSVVKGSEADDKTGDEAGDEAGDEVGDEDGGKTVNTS